MARVSRGWGRVQVYEMTVHWLGAQGYCRATSGGVGKPGRAKCTVEETLQSFEEPRWEPMMPRCKDVKHPSVILMGLRVRSESLNVRGQRTEVQVGDDRSG